MTKFLLSLSYDGSDYQGWVVQPHKNTIQGALNQTIYRTIKSDNFRTIGASKTDRGVHARDQKVVWESNFTVRHSQKLFNALNQNLPLSLHLNSLKIVENSFHLPSHIHSKTYLYTIETGDWSLHAYRFYWWLPGIKLDWETMQSIANIFVGTHNFRNFSGVKHKELNKINTTRQIDNIKIWREGSQIKLQFRGPSFIRYQIRMLVAAIVQGTINPRYPISKLQELLISGNRKFPYKAPPQGLTLEKITLLES